MEKSTLGVVRMDGTFVGISSGIPVGAVVLRPFVFVRRKKRDVQQGGRR